MKLSWWLWVLLFPMTAFAGSQGEWQMISRAGESSQTRWQELESTLDWSYADNLRGLNAHISYEGWYRDQAKHEGFSRFHQLWMQQDLSENLSLQTGRLEKIDESASIFLDGFRLRNRWSSVELDLYEGIPSHFEGPIESQGSSMQGVSLRFPPEPKAAIFRRTPSLQRSTGHLKIGLWRTRFEALEERATWSFSSGTLSSNSSLWHWRVQSLGGVRLDEGVMDRGLIDLNGDRLIYGKSVQIRLGVEQRDPDLQQVRNFQDHFYQHYAPGKERLYYGNLHLQWSRGLTLFGSYQSIKRALGPRGGRSSAGWEQKSALGDRVRGEWNFLRLGVEQVETFFLLMERPINPTLLFLLQLAWQQQTNRISGDRKNQGWQVEFQKMLQGDLYLLGQFRTMQQETYGSETSAALGIRWLFNGGKAF